MTTLEPTMNRRLPARPLATAFAAAALALALAALPAVPSATARRAEPTATPPSATTRSGCRVETARDVDAARVGLTDTVAVTLTVTGCLPAVSPMHIALVIDTDLGDAREAAEARAAIDALVTNLDLPANPTRKFAVIAFGVAAHTMTALTNDDQRVRGAVRRVRGAAGDAVGAGIDAGRRELARGRRDVAPNGAVEILIVLSSAEWKAGTCGRALAAAGGAKGEGILMITAMTRRAHGDVQCMRGIAASPRYFFGAGQIGQMVRIFDPIREQSAGGSGQPAGIVITDTIAAAFDVDGASIRPTASTTAPDGRTLVWTLPNTMTLPAAAVTVTYRLRPLALGVWPVSLGATAAFTDWRARSATVVFPPASVEVVGRIDPSATGARVCPATRAAVPADVLAAALARPDALSGWRLRCSESQPAGPANPPRRSLRLARPGMAYHPVANGLVWACGCR